MTGDVPCPASDVAQICYRDAVLSVEGVGVDALARDFGTPTYVYSAGVMRERFAALRDAFGERAHICYAVKANSNLHVLRLFEQLGAGFDLVSGGELARVRAARIDPARAVMAGVAKQRWEVDAALQAGIRAFNLESPHELEVLSAAGAAASKPAPLALRLNPDVDANTHDYISTGKKGDKFGVGLDAAPDVVARIAADPWLELKGYHVHLGSQIRTPAPYLEAIDKVLAFMGEAPERRAGVDHFDLGGGYGIAYGDGGGLLDVAALGAAVQTRLADTGLDLMLEPGRYLVGDAGVLLTSVLGEKSAGARNFLIVDGAMNDLIRPSLYSAAHPVAPGRNDREDRGRTFDVVGPVCESGDFLALGRRLPELAGGDHLAVLGAGAYGAVMASNYNSRARPAEVLVDGDRAKVIRRRERLEDLWALEE